MEMTATPERLLARIQRCLDDLSDVRPSPTKSSLFHQLVDLEARIEVLELVEIADGLDEEQYTECVEHAATLTGIEHDIETLVEPET